MNFKLFLSLIVTLAIPAVLWSGDALSLPRLRKKLIECSWTTPSVEFLRDNIREMEADAPYDGIRIKLEATVTENGREFHCQPYTIFSAVSWRYEYFREQIEALKQVPFKRFTDNFLMTTVCPGVADWFDDAAWSAVCNNFAIMAKIARETGMKGICFDPEQYNTPLFSYSPGSPYSYEATLQQARRRGRQWGEAIFHEYPAITILSFFWISMNLGCAYADQPEEHLQKALIIPFINGVYDVLPPEAKLVDGHENGGYRATTPEQFFRLLYDVKSLAPALIDERNREKYRRQTQLAPAIYLDAFFVHPPESMWYLPAPETNRLEVFRRALHNAAAVSDEYLWTWGEQCRWWDCDFEPWQEELVHRNGFGNRWEESVPGVTRTIREVMEPVPAAPPEHSALKNLLIGGDFAADSPEKAKSNWGFWQQEGRSHGDYTVVADGTVNGSAAMRLAGVADGCLLQEVPVASGKRYLVRGKARVHGQGNATLLIRWKDAAGKFNDDSSMLYIAPERSDDGLLHFEAALEVPPCSVKLLPLFGTSGAVDERDFTDFDELAVDEL